MLPQPIRTEVKPETREAGQGWPGSSPSGRRGHAGRQEGPSRGLSRGTLPTAIQEGFYRQNSFPEIGCER